MPEEIYYIFESPSESDIHINEYVTPKIFKGELIIKRCVIPNGFVLSIIKNKLGEFVAIPINYTAKTKEEMIEILQYIYKQKLKKCKKCERHFEERIKELDK